MENIDNFPFKDPPANGATLMDLCSRVFAKNFTRYHHDTWIADLPIEVVSRLKSYVTPRMLHEIMPFLEKRGMNTSADWERFLQKGKDSYGYSSNRCRNSIDSLRKHGETINERGYMADDLLPRQSAVPFYHQEYISYHCADLISELLQMKQGEMPLRYMFPQRRVIKPTEKDISKTLGDLLYFLPSVVVLSIDLEDFSQLNQEQEILNILIENLETLVIGGMGSYAGGMPERRLTVAGAEKIAQILRKFCRSKAIKAITFDCHMCYDEYIWERENESLILKGLDIYETDEENINLNMKDNNKIDKNTTMNTKEINVRDENITLDKKDINVRDENITLDKKDINERDENITLDKKDLDNETHCENVFEVIEGGTPYLDDERVTIAMNRIHKVDQTWIDFQENLKAIEEACKTSQLQEARDKPTGNLEALSLCMNCFLYVGKYLPQCKTARRLAIAGSIIGNAPSDSLAREILTRIACHQLTHLHLSGVHCDNLVSRIFFIFHEYYRKGMNFKGPMEMLDLSQVEDIGDESYPMFEDRVLAVKDFSDNCSRLDEPKFSAYLTFLRRNDCLTHLTLGFKHSSFTSCVRILESLMESKVLQSIDLHGYPITYKDKVNKADVLVSFLNNVTTLRVLKLRSCCIDGDTVRRKDLIEAIQKHQSLKHLCFDDNDLGSTGADFLAELLMSNGGNPLNLTELNLSSCNIPGKDLLIAAENLNKTPAYRPLINKLKIKHYVYKADRKSEKELEEKLRKEYSKLVKCVEADFYRYNPHDQQNPYGDSDDDLDDWGMDENDSDTDND